MKLLKLTAAVALALAPIASAAADTKTVPESKLQPIVNAAPAPGGIAKSSISFAESPALVAFLIAAGGSAVISGIVFTLVPNDDDGTFTVTTTTN